jgi:hypothetical protein
MTALGGPYATRAQLKGRAKIPDSDTTNDAAVDRALIAGARSIHAFTHRQFGRAELVAASARTFEADGYGVDVDDFWSTTGLLVDGVAYTSASWTLLPRDGIKNQVPGYPYERIEYVNAVTLHPIYAAYRGPVEVTITAPWGWAEVPGDVVEANLILGQDILKSGDAPFGVAGFGDYVLRVRQNPKAAELLSDYVLERLMVAS